MKLHSPSSADEGWLLVRGISTGPAFQNYSAEKTKVEEKPYGAEPKLGAWTGLTELTELEPNFEQLVLLLWRRRLGLWD